MKHPNTVAAIAATQAVVATQWLVQRYAHTALSDYWKAEVVAGVTVTVLYVGKNGVKAALLRGFGAVKALWAGAGAEKATSSKTS